MQQSKFSELKQGPNKLIWHKLERKFVWKKLSKQTIVVEETIAYIGLNGRQITLFDKNGFSIGCGEFDEKFYTLKSGNYNSLIEDYAIDKFIHDLIFVKNMSFSILINYLIWKADKIV